MILVLKIFKNKYEIILEYNLLFCIKNFQPKGKFKFSFREVTDHSGFKENHGLRKRVYLEERLSANQVNKCQYTEGEILA